MSRGARAGVLTGVVVVIAILAVALHRSGHAQGDDFALFLRQARSIFDGDTGAVIADNRFSVVNSGPRFSPIGYPWGWPLLLSPFVWQWGLDYDRLKLVEVGAFCLWIVLLHGIVRRRIGWVPAIAVVLTVGTAPAYLAHTDRLLSEYPYLAAICLVVWWYDRIRSRADLLTASVADLVVLGLLAALAFNVRREGIVLVGVVALMQLFDVVRREGADPSSFGARVRARIHGSARALVTPHAAFFGAVVVGQLALPSTLFPDNDNSFGNIDDRLREMPANLTEQLELGVRPQVGLVVLLVAVVGAVIGVRRRIELDLPIVALAALSALTIGTHFREVGRYWLQVTPWVVYFATAALVALVPLTVRRHPRVGMAAALAPLAVLVAAHAVMLVDDVGDARRFDADGQVQWGPTHPDVVPIYDAVEDHTPPDATVAFLRARTMTLLTDRRAIQTKVLEDVLQNADYFAQRRGSDYSQPSIEPDDAEALGMVEVWSDEQWILWRLPMWTAEPSDYLPADDR